MDNYTTLEEVLRDRAQRGMSDILYDIYMAGYSAGAAIADDRDHSAGMRQLIWLLEDRRCAAIRAAWPAGLADELPSWLQTLAQQVDAIDPPPIDGWPV